MLSETLVRYIKNLLPELSEIKISISGELLPITGFELVNALLIKNNILDKENKNIAIFHSEYDILDIFLLIVAGLAAYESSINNSSELKIKDFAIGELVEFDGKLGWFKGSYFDSSDNREKFRLAYDDQYHTEIALPIRRFVSVSKYSGSKTTADSYDSKKSKKHVKDALGNLFGLKEGRFGLSGYDAFLVCSERPRFLDILKQVEINGMPFFDMFPSVKCTSSSRQRMGRDRIQRAFMFYFVASISTADDVMSTEKTIKDLFVDARSKNFTQGSLLASIRSQYDIEDIYWLQNYERIDSLEKLDSGLGFDAWIWRPEDLGAYKNKEIVYFENLVEEGSLPPYVKEHRNSLIKLAKHEENIIEIPYPEGFSFESNKIINKTIRDLFYMNKDFNNPYLQNFTITAAGLSNKIFQSNVPLDLYDENAEIQGKNKIRLVLDRLIDLADEAMRGSIADNFEELSINLTKMYEDAIDKFYSYEGKLNVILNKIEEFSGKSINIISKYPWNTPILKKALAQKLQLKESLLENAGISFIDKPNIIHANTYINLWTYKPKPSLSLLVESPAILNSFLLYPLQKEELSNIRNKIENDLSKYFEQSYRANLLKAPIRFFDEYTARQQLADSQVDFNELDIDSILSSVLTKTAGNYQYENTKELVGATMVTFSDGSHAFFQDGYSIRTISSEKDSIEKKKINNLLIGDEVIFLKETKRSVFEELVDFYQHKPEIIQLVNKSKEWNNALIKYMEDNGLDIYKLQTMLEQAGLKRHIITLQNWLDGSTIYPQDAGDESAIKIIAGVTGDNILMQHEQKIKTAARKLHALYIQIGRYLSKKITQSFVEPESVIDDPVLRDKLDEISSHAIILQITEISGEKVTAPVELTNRVLSEEDIYG